MASTIIAGYEGRTANAYAVDVLPDGRLVTIGPTGLPVLSDMRGWRTDSNADIRVAVWDTREKRCHSIDIYKTREPSFFRTFVAINDNLVAYGKYTIGETHLKIPTTRIGILNISSGVETTLPLDPESQGENPGALVLLDERRILCGTSVGLYELDVIAGETRKVVSAEAFHSSYVLGYGSLTVCSKDRVATGSYYDEEGRIQIWDTTSWECVQTLTGGHSKVVVNIIALTPERLVSVGSDGTLRVWDLLSGECHKVIKVDDDFGEVSFATDLKLVKLSNDKFAFARKKAGQPIRIFDATTGECLHELPVPEGEEVNCMVLKPTGHLVAGINDKLHLWKFPEFALIPEVDIPTKGAGAASQDALIEELRHQNQILTSEVTSLREQLTKQQEQIVAQQSQMMAMMQKMMGLMDDGMSAASSEFPGSFATMSIFGGDTRGRPEGGLPDLADQGGGAVREPK